jgi:hypothetical protein
VGGRRIVWWVGVLFRNSPVSFSNDSHRKVYSQIYDDNFLHALRIFRDRITGAVRLQASVHQGELKR